VGILYMFKEAMPYDFVGVSLPLDLCMADISA